MGWFRRSLERLASDLLEGLGQKTGASADVLEGLDKAPFAERVAEVYWFRFRDTGLGQDHRAVVHSELLGKVAECLIHFQATSPDDIARLERTLERYDRLRRAAGIGRRFLEEPSKLLPGPLGHVQGVAEAVLGAVPAAFGFLTGFIPYYVSRALLRRTSPGASTDARPARSQLITAGLIFGVFYGSLIGVVASQFSTGATALLAILLVSTGLFSLRYARRMRTIVAHLGARTASWFKLDAVARLRKAQDELVESLDALRNRYRADVLGLDPLPPEYKRRSISAALIRVSAIATLTAGALLFVVTYADQPVEELPLGPSPWQALRESNLPEAERELLRDARGVLLAGQQLDRMQEEMSTLRAEFRSGERDFLTQEDQDAMRTLFLAYLDLRDALWKTVWRYRGDNTGVAAPGDDPLENRAFLTAYAASVLLAEKAWLMYDTFRDDPTTRAQLDRADLAWSIPAGAFSSIVANLSNRSVMAELQAAVRHFESEVAAGRFPDSTPWSDLVARARSARPAVDAALEGIGRRNLERTFSDMARQIREPAGEITPVVSMAISRFRFKERPPHRGLISPEQLEDLRARLRPGDILIERRNWFVSNSLLPGFWPHAALYLGSYEELVQLGVAIDPRAAQHLSDFQGQDELGHDFAVIEAIGEGVIFTSLEHSVGEADAVAVLRPILSETDLREALGRALSHRGKEYDFDFDFLTTDRLVCTELIFRAYDGLLEIPEMRLIMGQPRIAAGDYVRMWADGRASGEPQLELVRFLDFNEADGVSFESDADTLVGTLTRSRFTFLN